MHGENYILPMSSIPAQGTSDGLRHPCSAYEYTYPGLQDSAGGCVRFSAQS